MVGLLDLYSSFEVEYFRPESDRHYMLCCVHWVNVLVHALHGYNAQDLTAIMVVMVRG